MVRAGATATARDTLMQRGWNTAQPLDPNASCVSPFGAINMIRHFVIVILLAASGILSLATKEGTKASDLAGHGFAPVGGTRLFYEVKGMGPALVLIHGGQMDSRMWDDQFALLAKQFTVIRYDVRGYGGSFQPDQLYSDTDDLAGLLDYLKVKNAHIVGLSLGGRIAIDFALVHPKRVKSLTLAGPGLAGYEAPNSEESDLRMWNLVKA